MARERTRTRKTAAEDFDTSLMYDDIEKIRNIEEQEEKDQNDKLSFAGVMALMAGIIFFVTSWMLGPGGSHLDIVEFLQMSMGIVGIGSLVYGVFKTLGLAFRKKELNFPALNVYRKTKPISAKVNSDSGSRTRTRTRNESARTSPSSSTTERSRTTSNYEERSRAYARRQQRRKAATKSSGLMRSRINKVFTGVAGGLAEFLNISPALIRFSFILALMFSGGTFIFVYLLLSIVLQRNYDFPMGGTDRGSSSTRRKSYYSGYDN